MVRFWGFASEHKLFSGFVGSVLVAAVALATATGRDQGDSDVTVAHRSQSSPPAQSSPERSAPEDAGASDTALGDYIEAEEPESFGTENTMIGQVTVDAITDPLGIRMELGEGHESGALTINTEGAFTTIHGQVGITSDPCSPGSTAEVAVRGEEGETLWPTSGGLEPVGRKPKEFDVPIGSTETVVLYATAPLAEEGYCGAFLDTTEVGWVHGQLLASE
jgi:hypothetical protein